MHRTAPALIREGIVMRFAEKGYQIEPEALEAICCYSGSTEELVRRIIGSIDRSVAVMVLPRSPAFSAQELCRLPREVILGAF